MIESTEKSMDYSSKAYLSLVDRYWRAANYLSIGQIYLKDNPLLDRPIVPSDIKRHPIGHWGTISGQNFIYAHLNRIINKYNLNMFYIEGPGHGGQVMVSNAYLDGSYSEIYPTISQDKAGIQRLFKQFSWPGGVASHAAPETPGSIHEGGELGYSVSHAIGAILDNPDQIAAAVIGDGEAETGPLATSWHANHFINPIHDGAILPILYINGYKLSNPTIFSRTSDQDLAKYFEGMGWEAYFVEGSDPQLVHPAMAQALDQIVERIKDIQKNARENNDTTLPKWPLLIFRSPKGWTGPKSWEGKPVEDSFRSHQIPIPVDQQHLEHVDALIHWLKSYKPEELFNQDGSLKSDIKRIIPKGTKRMSTNPITNGGVDPRDLRLPNYRDYAIDFKERGEKTAQDMLVFGSYVRDIISLNPDNFRVFGPDETASNRLGAVFEVTNRQWLGEVDEPRDEFVAPSGRVLDAQLSEHQAEGWLEGYTLTGRHGFFASYESFLRVVDSMLTQHFKWLRKSNELSWRKSYPSLNVIASSTVFQQDHNGYSHQDPGLLSHLAEKKHEYVREYLPADANTLLAVTNKMFHSRNKINLVIASKHPRQQWFSIDEASELVDNGLGIIDWASTDQGTETDLVIASSGTEPTLESLAAIQLLHQAFPEMKIRFVNVVDVLKLKSPRKSPRGLTDEVFDHYFTKSKPILFAFHGYEDLIEDLFFGRHNTNLTVHGYRENGDITTPFDMRVLNHLDRFHLAKAAVMLQPNYAEKSDAFIAQMDHMIAKHNRYIREEGADLPEVASWKWTPLN
ncbi:phosphoketolase family protein [Sporolactobacillus shoreicorticis]|uniref:Probable phosphoketolase n=1 Tax=Sporolactobacillus shoreicorticis TaxID=1923877 RepID=A0ABW5S4A6_9BACL|nr:phosphoketolase family protein [Sporolactobacillus shoreicorticis]MCO7127146.1 phosphoketolase family protein [Sporolactobacillus shoreicorticis]